MTPISQATINYFTKRTLVHKVWELLGVEFGKDVLPTSFVQEIEDMSQDQLRELLGTIQKNLTIKY